MDWWPFRRLRSIGMQVSHEPPLSLEARSALSVLRAAPGPSPWYLSHPASQLKRLGEPLRWEGSDKQEGRVYSTLRGRGGAVYAVAGFGAYVGPLVGDRFLVWWEDDRAKVGEPSHSVHLRVYEAAALEATAERTAVAELPGTRGFWTATPPTCAVSLSTSLSDGEHRLPLPSALAAFGPIVAPVKSTADGRRDDGWEQIHQRLWWIDGDRGTLRVLPQDWYNRGPYDFGYQWPTRAAVDPSDGAIVVEGIRLGLAKLDAAGQQVGRWIHRYEFYMPDPARGEA